MISAVMFSDPEFEAAFDAVGATSNPVIVFNVVQNNLEKWGNRVDSQKTMNRKFQ